MKVLLVNGSSHEHGTTMAALSEMIKVFEAEGVETEVFQLKDPISDCLQCGGCRTKGCCVLQDGGVNEFVEKARQADGFVFGTPVYYAHPSGRIFSFLDRAFYSNAGAEAFRFKPAASVAVARRGGTSATLDALNKYFTILQMPLVSSQYWNSTHGFTPDEVRRDLEGMQTMRTLGNNMAHLLHSLKKADLPLPEQEPRVSTNFIS